MSKKILHNYRTMGRNAALLTVSCLLLCLSFNYTFPLHSENAKWSILKNRTQQCDKEEHVNSIVDRTKKMAANIENALKKMIDTTQDKDKINSNKGHKCSHAKLSLADGDLSNYEQLVIMKKYPYLDLKESDSNYRVSLNKNVKQSVVADSNLGQDSSIYEPSEYGPNVEIINRGLSGFAIPTKLMKVENVNEKLNNAYTLKEPPVIATILKQPLDNSHLLHSLEEDIRTYEKKAGSKI